MQILKPYIGNESTLYHTLCRILPQYLTESIRGDLFLSHKEGPGNFVAYSDVEKRAELVHRQKDYPMKTICKEAHVQYQIYGEAPSQQFLTLSDADLDDILRKIMLRKCFRQMY